MWKDHFISQSEHQKFLSESIQKGTLPHAMLFYGHEGSGQLVHALLATQLLFCSNISNHLPCNTCSGCRKTLHLNHPDVHFLLPTSGSDALSQHFYTQWRESLGQNPYLNSFQWIQKIAENKQGNINAKDCLHAYQKMNMQAFEGGKKVLIIWMAEYLGADGNRLLKLIEEPPENTHIILIAENRDLILPTILSRCQQLYFKPFQSKEIEDNLINQEGFNPALAAKLASISEGNFNEALNSSVHANQEFEKILSSWIKACAKKEPSERVKWVEQAAKLSKEEQKQFLKYSLQMTRKSVLKNANQEFDASDLERKMIDFMSTRLSIDQFHSFVSTLSEAIFQITRNANPKITWLHCSIIFHKALAGRKIVLSKVY
jgi:DNA polymerase-3 subunit delta'